MCVLAEEEDYDCHILFSGHATIHQHIQQHQNFSYATHHNNKYNMVVRLRLQRFGRVHSPFYRMVAADARAPRDGKFLEIVSIGK